MFNNGQQYFFPKYVKKITVHVKIRKNLADDDPKSGPDFNVKMTDLNRNHDKIFELEKDVSRA